MPNITGHFRAHITPVQRLIATTVGRSDMLNEVLDMLKRKTYRNSLRHFLFVGPEGIGKTHFLSLVENAACEDENINNQYVIVRMAGENHRILCAADIITQLIHLIEAAHNGEDRLPLFKKFDENVDDATIAATVSSLTEYRKQTGRSILLLMENLDTIFGQQLRQDEDLRLFRTLLSDSSSIVLVGTASLFFPVFPKVNSSLFEYFNVREFRELSWDLAWEMLKKNYELEKDHLNADRLNEFEPRIKALITMTGCNPRLIMMLYEFIFFHKIEDIRQLLNRLLDRVSPVYQARMKTMAPQERAVMQTMALMRTEPRTPANIASRMRKSPQQISSLLKRMGRFGYLTVSDNPRDKRSRIYRIKEDMFDLWLATNESIAEQNRFGDIAGLFEVWYREHQKSWKRRSKLMAAIVALNTAPSPSSSEAIAFEVIPNEIPCQSEYRVKNAGAAFDTVPEDRKVNIMSIMMDPRPVTPGHGIYTWMIPQVPDETDARHPQDADHWFFTLVEKWKIQRSGDLEKAATLFFEQGTALSGYHLHKIRIQLLRQKLSTTSDTKEVIHIHKQIAWSQKQSGKLDDALHSLNAALDLSKDNGHLCSESSVLDSIAQISGIRGDYKTALTNLEHARKICEGIGHKVGEATVLNNIAGIYRLRGDFKTALAYLDRALKIYEGIGQKAGAGAVLNNTAGVHRCCGGYETAVACIDQSFEIYTNIGDGVTQAATLNNMSQIHGALGEDRATRDDLGQALSISLRFGDKSSENTAFNNIYQILITRGDHEIALACLKHCLALAGEIGDKSAEGTTLNNISQVYEIQGDFETALGFLQKSLSIRQSIGDKSGEGAILNNIAGICRSRGDSEKALDYLKRSLAIFDEIGDKAGLGVTLNNIAGLYKNDSDTATRYLMQSLAVRQETGDKEGQCATLINIGRVHYQSGAIHQAMQSWAHAYQLAKTIGSPKILNEFSALSEKCNLSGGAGEWERMCEQMEGEP